MIADVCIELREEFFTIAILARVIWIGIYLSGGSLHYLPHLIYSVSSAALQPARKMTDRTRGESSPSPRKVACPSAALCNEDRRHLDELKYHVRQRCGILTEKNDTARILDTWNSRRRARPEDKIKEEIEAFVKEFPGVEVEIYFEWPLHVKVSLHFSHKNDSEHNGMPFCDFI